MSVIEDKTLEELENDYWTDPGKSSYLIETVYQLRKKPIADLEVEDLRLLLSQNVGLTHLMPLAIEHLKEDILSEGDYYEGDLLNSVLTTQKEFWQGNEMKDELIDLVSNQVDVIKQSELTEDIKEKIFRAFEDFRKT